ncbi:MOSC domain-containing protein [Blastococcus sp. SYSU DS0617]
MHIDALYRFPVKSMLGEQVERASLTGRGLLGDRAYALVDRADGTVASAKHPRKWGALLGLSARFAGEPVPGAAAPPVLITMPDGTELSSDAAGTDAALSDLVGRPVRLTSEVPAGSRFEEQWPAIEGLAPAEFIEGTTHSFEGEEPVSAIDLGQMAPPGTFFDLAALHLLTRATLDQLTELGGGSDFDALRYRPNVLVGGTEPGFAEDDWVGRSVCLGDSARAGVRMLTMRCVMTTLAQGDLPEDRGTLRTVARHHRREIPGLGTWACAGVYADVTGEGVVRTGDPVTFA